MRRLALALIVLAGCGPGPDLVGALRTAGVRATVLRDGYDHFASADGYAFDMPGVPTVERSSAPVGATQIVRTRYELRAEVNTRRYDVTVYDCAGLGAAAIQPVAEYVARRLAQHGTIVSDRVVVSRGGPQRELVVEHWNGSMEHVGTVRLVAIGRFVFELRYVVDSGFGDTPREQARFFDSLVVPGAQATAIGADDD